MPRLYPNKVYDVANQRYFGGRLPKVRVRFVPLPDNTLGRTFRPPGKIVNLEDLIIELNSDYRRVSVIWIQTLLHEMVHIELWNRRIKVHGYVFDRRIKELVAAGAFKDLL